MRSPCRGRPDSCVQTRRLRRASSHSRAHVAAVAEVAQVHRMPCCGGTAAPGRLGPESSRVGVVYCFPWRPGSMRVPCLLSRLGWALSARSACRPPPCRTKVAGVSEAMPVPWSRPALSGHPTQTAPLNHLTRGTRSESSSVSIESRPVCSERPRPGRVRHGYHQSAVAAHHSFPNNIRPATMRSRRA